jgi:hypothetical protein
MEDIPGLVICDVCGRSGPGGGAINEENRWTCRKCLGAPPTGAA